MSQEVPASVLDEMSTYYRERANEYDEWFYRQGRYDRGSQLMTRKLNDGRAFEIVKNFYDPAALAGRFARHGLDVTVRETATFFLYGYSEKGKPII